MELGIYVNQYGDDRVDFGYEEMLEQVERIEELGYDSVAVGERHFYRSGFLDPWTCLSAIGTRTDDLTVASNVLVLPIHHPVHVAERMANLDRLTDGRTLFGLAVGYRDRELTNFGVGLDERGSRFAESVELVKRLLAGDRVDFDGDYYSVDDAVVRPTPVQRPRPTLLGGGGGPIARKRAAYRCDGFTASSAPPEALADELAQYREAVEAVGGDPSETTTAVMLNGFVAETEEEAREALDPSLFDLLELYATWGNPHAERPSWEDVEDELLAGPPAVVADRLEEYEAAGVDHVFFRPQFPGMDPEVAMDAIERFGRDVVPQF